MTPFAEAAPIAIVGYAVHTIMSFAFDLRGVRLARGVFPIGANKFWERPVRHAAFHGADNIDKQEIVIRTSLVKKKGVRRDDVSTLYTYS